MTMIYFLDSKSNYKECASQSITNLVCSDISLALCGKGFNFIEFLHKCSL